MAIPLQHSGVPTVTTSLRAARQWASVLRWPLRLALRGADDGGEDPPASNESLRFSDGAISRVWDSHRCDCGLALEGRDVEAYNEEAFRYFLGLERVRAARSRRLYLLLLVRLKASSMAAASDPAAAERMLAAVSGCVRDADFVGWFRERRIAGAVLAQRPGTSIADVVAPTTERVKKALSESLPSHIVDRLQVRVVQLRAR